MTWKVHFRLAAPRVRASSLYPDSLRQGLGFSATHWPVQPLSKFAPVDSLYETRSRYPFRQEAPSRIGEGETSFCLWPAKVDADNVVFAVIKNLDYVQHW
jgi:hypothetical protein